MDTFADLIQGAQDDLTIDDNSTLYPPALVKRAINRAKRKIEGLFRWPELEDAKKTSTVSGQEYYDYPQAWRPDSIWKLWVDSDDNDFGDPIDFKDYLYEQENDFPAGKETLWGNQWRRFFFRIDGEITTTNGNNNITIWGIKVTSALSATTDTTIWSYSMPEVNEAIVLEAVKILKAKGEEQQSGELLSAEAKATVVIAWNRLKQDKAREEKTQPLLNVQDMFQPNRAGRKDTNIGKF